MSFWDLREDQEDAPGDSIEKLEQQLAAAQAREKVLRKALEKQPRTLRTVWKDGIDLDLPDYATEIRDTALAQPTDDTALQNLLLEQHNTIVDEHRKVSDEFLKAALKTEREKYPLHDAADIATKAMRRAWQLGQTYWQQADSESYSQNAKSAITQDTFNDLLDSTADAIRALEDE